MDKAQFLKELEILLSDINDEERQEALSFYQDYFEEAGVENEQRIIQELGSPLKVANIIRDSIQGRFEETITSSEEGFTNKEYEEVYEVQEIKKQGNIFDRFNDLTMSHKALFIFLIIFCLFPLTALLAEVFGFGLSLIVSIFTFIFGAWILTFALFVSGVSLIVMGVLTAFRLFPLGLIMVGCGMMLIAISFLTKELAKIIFTLIKKLFTSIKTSINGEEVTV